MFPRTEIDAQHSGRQPIVYSRSGLASGGPALGATDQLQQMFFSRNGQPVTIEECSDKHAGALEEFYRRIGQEPPSPTDAALALSLAALSFTEEVLGHCFLRLRSAKQAEACLHVRDDYRGQGIGTVLLRTIISAARDLPISMVTCRISGRYTASALRVFRKCGFAPLAGHNRQEGSQQLVLDLNRRRRILSAPVRRVMNREVITVRPDQPCSCALRLFLSEGISTLPVVDGNGSLLGLVSQTDILGLDGKAPVRDVMSSSLTAAAEDVPLDQAIRLLEAATTSCLPVVDRGRKLLGIVGQREILAFHAQNSR